MQDVVTCIEQIREIAAKAGKSRLSEANTIFKLIIPVLHALGWVAYDEVEHQYACKGGGAVDIALCLGGKPRLFVEAKAYTPNVSTIQNDKHALQAITYGAAEGVEWCLLTNGGRYELYNTTVSLPLTEKLAFSVDVMKGSPSDSAERLSLLSRDAVHSGHLGEVGARLLVESRVRAWLAEGDAELVALFSKRLSGKVPQTAIEAALKSLACGTVQTQSILSTKRSTSPIFPSPQGSYGIPTRLRPITQDGQMYKLSRRQPSGEVVRDARVRVKEFPKLVAACVELQQKGELISAPALKKAVGREDGTAYRDAVETISILYVIGAAEHVGGNHPQLFRLKEGMTEEKIHALLQQALEEDKGKA